MKFILASLVAGAAAVNVETKAHSEVHPHHRHNKKVKSSKVDVKVESNMTTALAAKMKFVSAVEEMYPNTLIMLRRDFDEHKFVDAWEQYQQHEGDMKSALSTLSTGETSDDIDNIMKSVKNHCNDMKKVIVNKSVDPASLTDHWSDFTKNWGLAATANIADALLMVSDSTLAITTSCVGYEESNAHCCNALQSFCCTANKNYQALQSKNKDYTCPKNCPGVAGTNQMAIPK